MKTSTSFVLAAVAAASMTTAAPMQTRDTVSCTKKYEGNLHIVRLTGGYGATPGDPNRQVAVNGDTYQYLSSNETLPAQRFQFDECVTSGWNDAVKEYGQIKPVDTPGPPLCVTVDKDGYDDETGYEALHAMSIKGCGANNDAGSPLEQQWFYANYISDGDFTPRIDFTFTGNPNNASQLTTFGETGDANGWIVGAEALDSPVPLSLSLFNVTVVS